MERVVITGMGCVAPHGQTVAEVWENVIAGRNMIGPITRFPTAGFRTTMAAEIRGFEPEKYMPRAKVREMDLVHMYAVAAAKEAMESSGLTLTDQERETTGVILGVGMGGMGTYEKNHINLINKGPGRLTPYGVPQLIPNLAAGHVSMLQGLKGPNYTIASACASSAHAMGDAVRWIRSGQASIMLSGGSESTITPMSIGHFGAMYATSKRTDDQASRPWDKARDGFVMGEGSAVFVLESLTHARARGAHIFAEIVGYGASSDAHHLTQPAPGGEGAKRAMQIALKQAGLTVYQIDYINAHGTSTPVGDLHELEAIKAVFGDALRLTSISSTKSSMGHLIGAAGAVEALMCIKAIETGLLPPTLHLDDPEEATAGIDLVPHRAKEKRVKYALSNSFGFGGANGTLIFAGAPS